LIVEPQEETALAAAGVPGVLSAGPDSTNDLDHLITMVIQDKTFVPDTNALAAQDPLWQTDAHHVESRNGRRNHAATGGSGVGWHGQQFSTRDDSHAHFVYRHSATKITARLA
jgi:hypothetical protein